MMRNNNNDVLDQLYKEVINPLARALPLANDDIILNEELEGTIQRQTWYPVAQVCVLAILEPILNVYQNIGIVELTQKIIVSTWRNKKKNGYGRNNIERIALMAGLNLVDTEVAMAVTAKAIAESDVFKTPKTLEMGGKQIIVQYVF